VADQRLRDVWQSLKPPFPALLSKDGLEGPGAWGLNKKCFTTVVLVKGGKVVYNMAALAAGDKDFETLQRELSKLLGVKIEVKPETAGAMGGRGEAPMGGREMGGGGRETGGRGEGRRGAGDAQRARVESDLRAFAKAIALFQTNNEGKLPSSLDVLVEPDSEGVRYLANLKVVPKDPWGHEYRYRVDASLNAYELKSFGADGAEGGAGRDADVKFDPTRTTESAPSRPRPNERPASRPNAPEDRK